MKKIVIGFVFLLVYLSGFAQCAMCKAQLETRVEKETGIGTGINAGVLYLMVMPYLLLLFIVLMYRYKKLRMKNAS